jgi:hypothetical protein
MKHSALSFVVAIGTVALVVCSTDAVRAAAQAYAAVGITGKVVETMNSGGYTYVQVDDGAKKLWAAAPQFVVAVGDKVVVPDGMPMQDFQSKTLGRTFDVVYFVPGIQVVGGHAGSAAAAPAHGVGDLGMASHGMQGHGSGVATAVDLSNIKKADGGQTVAELFANKAALTGKDVAVRGRVVKYTSAVMGKNWIHVQDGTGSTGANDLTVSTSSATAAVGDTVLVRGKLGADKDLGAGYHYDVIIEDAAVAVE